MARFRLAVEYRAVAQLVDPAAQAVDRLRDRALARPVADRALDVGIAADVLHHQLVHEGFPRPQLVHVDDVRRDRVHQRMGGRQVVRVQVLRQDVRVHHQLPAVGGMPALDLALGHCPLGGRHVAGKVHVNGVEIPVARLDHQVAHGRADHLRVANRQAGHVQLVRQSGLDHRLPEVGRLRVQVLHLRVVDVRAGDRRARDVRDLQRRLDGAQVGRADLVGGDRPRGDLPSRHGIRRQLLGGNRQCRDLRRVNRPGSYLVRRHRPGRDGLRGDRARRNRCRGNRAGCDLVRRHAVRRQLVRGNGLGRDLVGRDGLRRDQLRRDLPAGDPVRGDAVCRDLPRRHAVRHQGAAADASRAQRPRRHGSVAQLVAGDGALHLLVAKGRALVAQQDRVPGVPGHPDGRPDVQRSADHFHPVPGRGVHQAPVLRVFLRVRHMDPVQLQLHLGHVCLVDGEAVLGSCPHALVDGILVQGDLLAVGVLDLLAHLQPGVQHLRLCEGHRPHGVDVFLRQGQGAPVLRLGNGIYTGHDVPDVPGPPHALHVDPVADRVPRNRLPLCQQVYVKVVPDQHPAGGLQDPGLRVQDRRLRVLPAEVRRDRQVRQVRLDLAGVRFLHGPRDEHHRGRRRHVRQVAFAQHRAPQLVAHVLAGHPQRLAVPLVLPDVRHREALLRDRPSRNRPLLALPGGGAFVYFDVSLISGQRRDFHPLVVEVAGLHDHRAGLQRGDQLALFPGRVGYPLPPAAVALRRHLNHPAGGVVGDALVVVPVVGHLVPDLVGLKVHLAVHPRLVAHPLHGRHVRVELRALRCRHRPVAHRAQVDVVNPLPRNRAPDHHAPVDRRQVVRDRQRHLQVVLSVLLVGDRRLAGVQRDAVQAEVRLPLGIKFNQSPSPRSLLRDTATAA